MTRAWFSLTLALVLTLSASGAEPKVVKLWPGNARASGRTSVPEVSREEEPKRREASHERQRADISIYAAEGQGQQDGRHCRAGRRYNILAIEHEGSDVCEWLNTLGFTAVLLSSRAEARDAVAATSR